CSLQGRDSGIAFARWRKGTECQRGGLSLAAGQSRLSMFAVRMNALTGGRPCERRWKMATYIMLTRLTDKGAETIKENPARIEAVSKELEKVGVKVTAQYAVLGPFDFVNVIEAPDNMTVARVSAELASRGTVRIQTLPAVPTSEFIAKLK